MKTKIIKIVKIVFLSLWVAVLCFSFLGLYIYIRVFLYCL